MGGYHCVAMVPMTWDLGKERPYLFSNPPPATKTGTLIMPIYGVGGGGD